ncbi:MAG: sulfatase [Gemmataceae bacterium]
MKPFFIPVTVFLLSISNGNAQQQQRIQDKQHEKSSVKNQTKKRNTRPNVLFIAVDDMRVDLGCYGHKFIRSPHIDKLARRGTLFLRAYCQQAVCNPSRASLLTGLRPSSLGIWDLPTHFRENHPDIITLPQLFLRQGYVTINIGKIFHNWRQDRYKGDAASWSVPAVMHYNTHGADKAKVKGKLPPDWLQTPRCEMRDVPDDAYFDGRIANLAIKALRKLKQKDAPFFLAVGFWKPHAHFNAPKKYWDMYDRSKVKPPTNPTPPKNVPKIALHDSREILRGFRKRKNSQPTAKEVITLRHGYYAAISYVDAQIGKVIVELDRLGLADNTIIVFFSDHGYHLGEHGLWAKTSNFELDARVPMIIATPKHRGGQRTEALTELLDLYPTLTDLCRLPTGKHLEGKSLRPVLNDPEAKVKSAAFTWHPRPAYPKAGTNPKVMGFSMRTAKYRYTEWRDFKTGKVVARELYDHATDPRETMNVVNRGDMVKTVKSLERLLGKTHARGSAALEPKP